MDILIYLVLNVNFFSTHKFMCVFPLCGCSGSEGSIVKARIAIDQEDKGFQPWI